MDHDGAGHPAFGIGNRKRRVEDGLAAAVEGFYFHLLVYRDVTRVYRPGHRPFLVRNPFAAAGRPALVFGELLGIGLLPAAPDAPPRCIAVHDLSRFIDDPYADGQDIDYFPQHVDAIE
jgi:hypothetical protein